MKKIVNYSLLMFLFAFIGFACSKSEMDELGATASKEVRRNNALDKLMLSCAAGTTGTSINVQVTAGASGAPAGFSLQWMLRSEYEMYGWSEEAESYCGASFSGVPSGSIYNLGAGQSVTVTVGDVYYDERGASSDCEGIPLECGEEYVFRAFAHNEPGPNGRAKSAFSSNLSCSTLDCGVPENCTYTQGFWKTHGPEGCAKGNNLNAWPVASLELGSVTYTDVELCGILNAPVGGNGLINLAHQLIAAKLNVANGASATAIASAIASADALIGAQVVPPVGDGSLAPSAVSALVYQLTQYNEGATGPGHCSSN